MKRVSLEELAKESREESYLGQYQYICSQIQKKAIKPVKSSPTNGKTPALHLSYWRIEQTEDYAELIEELKFHMAPAICIDYYLKHPAVYQQEARWVRLLNRYFIEQGMGTPKTVSVNERSFQIWGREKFLQKEEGKKILSHCGISIDQLFVYPTTEPLAYFSAHKKVPQTILILENKDTFYSTRRFLLNGGEQIFQEKIGTVIYGAGKGILRSFEDFLFCVEPHIRNPQNQILYFGDLDYEGIRIYEQLQDLFLEKCKIQPFVNAYAAMLEKAKKQDMDFLPKMKEKQNRRLSGNFFCHFPKELYGQMQQLLSTGKYIPQEIITMADFDGEESCNTNF